MPLFYYLEAAPGSFEPRLLRLADESKLIQLHPTDMVTFPWPVHEVRAIAWLDQGRVTPSLPQWSAIPSQTARNRLRYFYSSKWMIW